MDWINKGERQDSVILAGDIGGTNANLALINYSKGAAPEKAFSTLLKAKFDSTSIRSLINPIEKVMSEAGEVLRPDLCCISAAGPVALNCCTPTNLTWKIDGDDIQQRFNMPTVVINDFEALGYSLPVLNTDDTSTVEQLPHPGGSTIEPRGNTWAVTGAGTGLGLSALARVNGAYVGRPSEGGHSDFAPFDTETEALKQYVERRIGERADTEMFLSGRGMAHILLFLHDAGRLPSDPLIDAICEKPISEIPPFITKNTDSNASCKQTMKVFFKIYGRFAGNASLYLLPYAGMFLAGGIVARHTKTVFEDDSFMTYFESAANPVMKALLQKIPVFVIKDYATSLIGAANAAVSVFAS